MGDAACFNGLGTCRDKEVALRLKLATIAIILVACILGVGLPILGKSYRLLRAESNPFFVMKSFAAGVILATGFVHMLPDAFNALTNPCLPEHPWSDFPFAGFVPMAAALVTLMIDFWGTAYYKRRHESSRATEADDKAIKFHDQGAPHRDEEAGIVQSDHPSEIEDAGTNNLSMVGIHAHASLHTHSGSKKWSIHPHERTDSVERGGHGSHTHFGGDAEDHSSMQFRHRVISQVLEMGIVAHSVIIGIALGTSESPCTIRPLIAALTFHQFFEGMALGGCIAQAGFKGSASLWMSFFFTITTPGGIAIGIGISSVYNENSPTALIVEGLFDSVSAGILVYMSLVDLIATDFLSKRLQSNTRLQIASYMALFMGAGAMSLIARWT